MKKVTQIRPLLPKKQREESLLQEMFPESEFDDLETKSIRNILAPLLEAYHELGCDEDEDED